LERGALPKYTSHKIDKQIVNMLWNPFLKNLSGFSQRYSLIYTNITREKKVWKMNWMFFESWTTRMLSSFMKFLKLRVLSILLWSLLLEEMYLEALKIQVTWCLQYLDALTTPKFKTIIINMLKAIQYIHS
jgi:hypothetical protein